MCEGKVKVLPIHAMKGRMEMEVMRHSLITSALGGGEW